MNAVLLVLQEHYIVLLMIVICVQQGQEIKDHAKGIQEVRIKDS